MTKEQTQIQFEAETFIHQKKLCNVCIGDCKYLQSDVCPMHEQPDSKDYIEVYAEPPRIK